MSEAVRSMFADIADRYDTTNTVLSMGIHHLWRQRAVRESGATTGDAVLDCATGTGDLALAFKRAVGPTGVVVGTDFCAEMLAQAPQKAVRSGLDVTWEVQDAMQLRFEADRFDVVSIAFGIRNVDDPARAVASMARVTKPGGRIVVLEFGQPDGAFGHVFRWYSDHVIPAVGGLITGERDAYAYLNRTSAAFPCGDDFVELMRGAAALRAVRAIPLTGGVAWLYIAMVD